MVFTVDEVYIQWTRKIEINLDELGENVPVIANVNFYLLLSKHSVKGFVCNWFGCHTDFPNSPKYSDVMAKEDAWFIDEDAAIAETKNELTQFLTLFAKG